MDYSRRVSLIVLFYFKFEDTWNKKDLMEDTWTSDIWSLGILLKYLLSGDSNYETEDLKDVTGSALYDFVSKCCVSAEFRWKADQLY